MLDLSHIPNSQQDIQIFQANGSAWETWQKPRKCNYVYIMCIGGAGGGAGGLGGVNSVYSTGGGSGGVSRALYNAQQLADRLYIQVGLGGAGGAGNISGSAGTRSWVALQPAIVAQNMVQGSGQTAAAGGTVGSGANAAGENIMVQTTGNFLTLSNFLAIGGVTAVGSGSIIPPPDITPLTSQITSAGAGGGNIPSTNGASILATSISPLIAGGTFTTVNSATAGKGGDGITSWKPFFSTGGAGGGTSSGTGGIGGNGGNGGIGSGGGAGGNGTSSGGTGGKGGDGLVIIISF